MAGEFPALSRVSTGKSHLDFVVVGIHAWTNLLCLRSPSCWELEQIVNHNKIHFKQWVLQKPSEKGVDRGKIVHHRHGTIWVMSSGKSGHGSFVARSRHHWKEIKRGNMIQSTPGERYPKVSYMRPEGTMEYYTDQTRPDVYTKAKCRHLKIWNCKGTLRQVFIRVYGLERQSVMLVFSTQLCELLPFQPSLWFTPRPPLLPVWMRILYTTIHVYSE